MKKKQLYTLTLVAALAATIGLPKANAADVAGASGMLADIAAIVVQAKQNLAAVAGSGDVAAIEEATKRADAIDLSMAEAMSSFSALESANEAGDDAAASAAYDDIASALQSATEALSGAVPELPGSAWARREGGPNTGGGPGLATDPPNIYNVPWQTDNLQSFYQALFGQAFNTTPFGDSYQLGIGIGEKPATPE